MERVGTESLRHDGRHAMHMVPVEVVTAEATFPRIRFDQRDMIDVQRVGIQLQRLMIGLAEIKCGKGALIRVFRMEAQTGGGFDHIQSVAKPINDNTKLAIAARDQYSASDEWEECVMFPFQKICITMRRSRKPLTPRLLAVPQGEESGGKER